MSNYGATVHGQRGEQPFIDKRYSRRHECHVDGGAVVPGSSSPHAVRVPCSDLAAVDPEEAFVASVSSCQMTWFLDIASRAGWVVDGYRDHALGVMAPNAEGKLTMTFVTLRSAVRFCGAKQPDANQVHALHHQAHAEFFVASSLKSQVRCEPVA